MPYDDFLEERQKEVIDIPMKKQVKTHKVVQKKSTKKPINEYQLAKAEKELELLEEKLNFVEEQMVINNANSEQLYELYKEKEQLEGKFEKAFLHWEELQK